MTEGDWWTCISADRMLTFLRGKASDRQLRLIACAIARQVWDKLDNTDSRNAVEVAEMFADGLASAGRLQSAWKAACLVYTSAGGMGASGVAANCAYATALEAASGTANHARSYAGVAVSIVVGAIREVVGNPFRPSRVHPAWALVNDRAVATIAETILSDQAFGRLPILADALEDAGCADDALLAHLRGPGPHVRGCWALDLVLGLR